MKIDGYKYSDANATPMHRLLVPAISKIIREELGRNSGRIFELGCGNGYVANELSMQGFHVLGVDPSVEGIAQAKTAYPELSLQLGSSAEDLAARFGQFEVVVSLEVVEHVYAPREYARRVVDLLAPGGIAVISTPYHGYAKLLAMAIVGRMDAHFTALWDGGHIKFWSFKTLRALFEEIGVRDIAFRRVGRIPPLAMSMIAIIRKPS